MTRVPPLARGELCKPSQGGAPQEGIQGCGAEGLCGAPRRGGEPRAAAAAVGAGPSAGAAADAVGTRAPAGVAGS